MKRRLTYRTPAAMRHHITDIVRHRQQPDSDEEQTRAFRWINRAISTWEVDGRITTREAIEMRRELARPEFLAVLPHFGVHLTIGVMLRFPLGSVARASYTLVNLLLVTFLWAVRRAGWERWRQALSIHSPLVILIAAMPGIGTFAYLASRPFRSNHLLLRISLDAALLKLPWRIYERTGIRWINARPRNIATAARASERTPLRLTVWPQSLALALGCGVLILFLADLFAKIADFVLEPDVPGWIQLRRILDLGAEASIGTWYAVALLILLSMLLTVVGFAKLREGDRFTRHWFILAFLALGISLDEQAKFHDAGDGTEKLREMLGMGGVLYYGWVLIGLLSAAIVALAYRHFIVSLPQVTRRLFVLAAGLFVVGEVGFEMISGWYIDGFGDTGRYDAFVIQILISIEEFLGMAGVFVAIVAILHYLQARIGEVHIALSDTSLAESNRSSFPMPADGGANGVEPEPALTGSAPVGGRSLPAKSTAKG